VILPLTALSLANIGMAMGAVLRNPDIIAGVTNLLLLVILLGAPVFIPQESLPVPLQILGYMLPPTYAADALRRALEGGGIALYGDLVVLTLFSIAGFSMTKRWLRW
jgi:ABC-2 type transport system permease protein